MGRTTLLGATLVTLVFSASLFLVSGDEGTQYGLDMVAKASRGICWSEKLNKPPPIKDQGVNYGTCNMNQKYDGLYEETKKKKEQNLINQGFDPKDQQDFLKNSIKSQLTVYLQTKLSLLPSKYMQACSSFIDNVDGQPAKQFPKVLGDSSGGAYPYKSLAHCLIQTLEAINGPKAVSELSEHINNPKPFHQDINDRENENRARHGVAPLQLDNELNVRAQRWADKLARDCKGSHHMADVQPGHADLTYEGDHVGENLSEGGSNSGLTDAEQGVDAANGWYSEIEGYPWPYYNGHNTGNVIGHFTQQVWKDSKKAGYGIGKSSNCDSVFIVARYSPTGNRRTQMPNGEVIYHYKENVMQPL
ncbi:unnamed protein product [Orchesella dallaii]|uniref:SCP domain-containing protein n=1 Tax=Orchesella dallaii TaxID=48710 RepID=A0ABP1S7P1_9HEXA